MGMMAMTAAWHLGYTAGTDVRTADKCFLTAK